MVERCAPDRAIMRACLRRGVQDRAIRPMTNESEDLFLVDLGN